jgi:hypothetical protein
LGIGVSLRALIQVNWRAVRKTKNQVLGNHIYKGHLKTAVSRFRLHAICSKKATPEWHSPSSVTYVNSTVDLFTCRWAEQENKWADVDSLWWSCLTRGRQLLVRKAGVGGRFMYCLGDHAFCCIGWPVVEIQPEVGGKYYVLDVSDTSEPIFEHITDPSAFEGFRWNLALLHPHRIASVSMCTWCIETSSVLAGSFGVIRSVCLHFWFGRGIGLCPERPRPDTGCPDRWQDCPWELCGRSIC